ncbi:helix-turn-helix transcriptional regulator [Nonomuraea sp. NPDC051941]|uniref:helix-turn-helix transcriptional regulator n=1 Tax=Nonomuraea sp. NPDC051941 TaxID=3364373 RepID=UPI0037C76325
MQEMVGPALTVQIVHSVKRMDPKRELREFLMSRRARLTPEEAGVLHYGMRARRVPGLRRDEVARLAGVSVDYYTRLERGQVAGASDSVLDAVARALRLDGAEREHLTDLARTIRPGTKRRTRAAAAPVRASLLRIVSALESEGPAFIANARMDILAANRIAGVLFSGWHTPAGQTPNHARFLFLSPQARECFPDWEQNAQGVVNILRAHAGRDPFDRGLSDLIGELSVRSDVFRQMWARHDVGSHYAGVKRQHHPAVGVLTLDIDLIADEAHLLEPRTRLVPRPDTDGSRTDRRSAGVNGGVVFKTVEPPRSLGGDVPARVAALRPLALLITDVVDKGDPDGR